MTNYSAWTTIGVIIVILGVFLIVRTIVLWYFKLDKFDEMVKNQEKIIALLSDIKYTLRDCKENNDSKKKISIQA